jgi:hypothetical protein
MKETDDRIPITVQTQRGTIAIEDINIGDMVYDYKTGKKIEVLDLEVTEKSDVYEIVYSDNRKGYYHYHEPIFLGDGVSNICTLLKMHDKSFMDDPINPKIYRGNIKQYPIDYNLDMLISPLSPDPYIAGALIIYGNYESEYINLPLDKDAANNLFAHKYQLNYAEKLDKNTVYFAYNGTSRTKVITWNEFFPLYNFYGKSKNKGDPIIPLEYLRASINDRWQFIRGVFDIGYSKYTFPDEIGISHSSRKNLRTVQDVLWSLGILSIINYNPNLRDIGDRVWHLTIVGEMDGYPGFFYNYDSIEHVIQNDTRVDKLHKDFILQIQLIRKYCKAYSTNLVLETPNAVYLTGDFLPRISA